MGSRLSCNGSHVGFGNMPVEASGMLLRGKRWVTSRRTAAGSVSEAWMARRVDGVVEGCGRAHCMRGGGLGDIGGGTGGGGEPGV